MKKILSFFTILVLSVMPSIAAISNTEMMNETYMRNQGYSPEAIRLVREQVYSPHKDKFESEDKSFFKKAWDKLNYYVDPAHDNGEFGRNTIEYTNRWDDI